MFNHDYLNIHKSGLKIKKIWNYCMSLWSPALKLADLASELAALWLASLHSWVVLRVIVKIVKILVTSCQYKRVPGSHMRVQDRGGYTAAAALWVCLGQEEDVVCSGQSPNHHPGQRDTHKRKDMKRKLKEQAGEKGSRPLNYRENCLEPGQVRDYTFTHKKMGSVEADFIFPLNSPVNSSPCALFTSSWPLHLVSPLPPSVFFLPNRLITFTSANNNNNNYLVFSLNQAHLKFYFT